MPAGVPVRKPSDSDRQHGQCRAQLFNGIHQYLYLDIVLDRQPEKEITIITLTIERTTRMHPVVDTEALKPVRPDTVRATFPAMSMH